MIAGCLEWVTLLYRAMAVTSALPIYEIEKQHVQQKWARLYPFNPRSGFRKDRDEAQVLIEELKLTGWRLAHAVKKADFLVRTPMRLLVQTGFFLEQLPTLDWCADNLRLFTGVATAYKDFSGTSLAGRIGQGVALLFMEKRGYRFYAHYPRMALESGPDFFCEAVGQNSGKALVESKGSFVKPGHRSCLKQDLRIALEQKKSASQPVAKSFAVATYLRETTDTDSEPSLIAFVDPDGGPADEIEKERPDVIRRCNYAAWLEVMGLNQSAFALCAGRKRKILDSRKISLFSLGGTEFGVVEINPPLRLGSEVEFPNGLKELKCVAGLPISQLKAIEIALKDPRRNLEVDEKFSFQDCVTSDLGNFQGSVFADGSLFAAIPKLALAKAELAGLTL